MVYLKYSLISLCFFFIYILLLYLITAPLRDLPEIKWDGLVFSQQWPISACILHKEQKKSSSCNLFKNMTSWTVHGLWPTKFGKKGPNFCNSSWEFNESKINALEPLLLKYWTNIYADTKEDSLWEHEWNKHGTCAAQSMLLDSEYKYFIEGLRLVAEYDMVSLLGLKGIVPSDVKTYSLDEIADSISSFTETSPIIDCMYNKNTSQHELWQIKLCFDRRLFLINCDNFGTLYRVRGNCPEKGIVYPSSVSTGGYQFDYTEELVLKHLKKFEKRDRSSGFYDILRSAMQFSLVFIPL